MKKYFIAISHSQLLSYIGYKTAIENVQVIGKAIIKNMLTFIFFFSFNVDLLCL